MRIAIIGAGMAGLSCAERLRAGGLTVALFDKGRTVGGRMSTRRAELKGAALQFDHGTQVFTVRDASFGRRVDAWAEAGSVALWPDEYGDAWIGQPAMNAPLLAMADNLSVTSSVRIEAMIRDGNRWKLQGEGVDETRYGAVVVAVPAEQAAPLLAPHEASMAALARTVRSSPCWTVMAAFDSPLSAAGPQLIRNSGAIDLAVRDSSKPGRQTHECWVIHATPEWSTEHLESDPELVVSALLAAFAEALGSPRECEALRPAHAAAHRWRYARPGSADVELLWNDSIGLGACGDWLTGPQVECAWLSGTRLGDAIVESLIPE